MRVSVSTASAPDTRWLGRKKKMNTKTQNSQMNHPPPPPPKCLRLHRTSLGEPIRKVGTHTWVCPHGASVSRARICMDSHRICLQTDDTKQGKAQVDPLLAGHSIIRCRTREYQNPEEIPCAGFRCYERDAPPLTIYRAFTPLV